ncbi:MAG: DUF3566 domain-containing protein [candidate division Zixibacteria bacterium]|nr:DUF3566 domain-containing protein [candidate division Zixibacteria bacterium]
MRYELKSISSWSYIKVMFFVNLIVGFVLGIFAGIFSGVFMSIAAELMFFPEDAFDMQTGFPIAIYVFVMGIMFSLGNAVFGTLFGAIIAGFYNLIVRMTGGLEFVLKPMANDSAAGPIAAQASLESLAGQPIKAKYIVPPPPPPVSGSAKPANADTDTHTESTASPLPPPPASKEAEKDDDRDNHRFKPPDYLTND